MINLKDLEIIEKRIMNCQKCLRLRNVTKYPMPHIYYSKTMYQRNIAMIIGRNPGLENSYENIKFDEFWDFYKRGWWKCRLGEYLKKMLGIEFIANNMYFTNICKCSSPKNTELGSTEISNCLNFLRFQIRIIEPKIILTIGRDARDALSHPKLDQVIKDIKVFSIKHPSSFSYRYDEATVIKLNNFKFNFGKMKDDSDI